MHLASCGSKTWTRQHIDTTTHTTETDWKQTKQRNTDENKRKQQRKQGQTPNKTHDRQQSTEQGQDTRQRGDGLDWARLDGRRRRRTDSEVRTPGGTMNTNPNSQPSTLRTAITSEITRFDGRKLKTEKTNPSTISKIKGFSPENRRTGIKRCS